jgi:cellulose synthase/poly-beta-1,6-N-acetylglucosamine synthase-like glycosyltransferase
MTFITTILFNIWIASIVLFILLYAGYLLFLFALAKIKGKKPRKSDKVVPFISILIPCYNVAYVIDQKIKNTLEIDYPREKYEIIVVESGSTDDSYVKLLKHAKRGEIKLLRQPKRLGKSSAINVGLKESKGEIIVLTDADAKLEKNSIRELVKNFADPKVGAVVANLTIIPGKSLVSKMNHLFYKFFRQKPRVWESSLDTASFWSGELCAFRKSVVSFIEEDMINDDRYILLKTRSQGYRAICDQDAYVYESDAENIQGQLIHKRRTVAGTIQGSFKFKRLLFNPKYGWFGMLIFPMHIIQIIVLPIIFLLIEVLTPLVVFLFFPVTGLYLVVAVLLTVAFLSIFKRGRSLFLSLLYSVIVQIAILAGIFDYLTKKSNVLWVRVPKRW